MTNSSDFRRYAYSADASYALEAFNAHRTAAAPAYQPPRRQRKRELRVHENTRLKSEQWSKGCTCPKEFPVCVCGNKPKGKALKSVAPSAAELEENPRARSARLRVFEKY